MPTLTTRIVYVVIFLQLARWSLLFSGIAWGIHRHKVNKRKEDEYQAYIAKMKPIWMENKRKILANRNRGEFLVMCSTLFSGLLWLLIVD